MTQENRRHGCAAELVRCGESLAAARLLIAAGLLHDAESRLYYAIYHAAVALLLSLGLESRSHSGVVRLLGQHFVQPGLLAAEDSRLFVRIQSYRLEADYGRDFVLAEAGVREDLAACEGFVARVRALLDRPDG